MLSLIDRIPSNEIFISLPIGSFFYLQREKCIPRLYLNFGRVIDWHALDLWELLERNAHSNHIFRIAVSFVLADLGEPDHGDAALAQEAFLFEAEGASVAEFFFFVGLQESSKALLLLFSSSTGQLVSTSIHIVIMPKCNWRVPLHLSDRRLLLMPQNGVIHGQLRFLSDHRCAVHFLGASLELGAHLNVLIRRGKYAATNTIDSLDVVTMR